MQPSTIVRPPWTLAGEGLVLLYHIPRRFNSQHGFMAAYQQAGYMGWVGAVILANYRAAEVGPYQELMYIPGLFRLGGRRAFSVSKIFVSTYDSLWNGQQNWGIPKELADFSFARQPDGTCTYEVALGRKPLLDARVTPWGPQLPFSSKLLPFTRIAQQRRHELLLTRPLASGHMRLASLNHLAAAPALFPPVHLLQPLLTLFLPDFRMTFPVPKVLPQP